MNEEPTTTPQMPEQPTGATCGCDCAMCASGQHEQCPTGKCTMKGGADTGEPTQPSQPQTPEQPQQ